MKFRVAPKLLEEHCHRWRRRIGLHLGIWACEIGVYIVASRTGSQRCVATDDEFVQMLDFSANDAGEPAPDRKASEQAASTRNGFRGDVYRHMHDALGFVLVNLF